MTCPPCHHQCDEGRLCPRRMQLHRLQPSDFGGSGRDSVRLPAPGPREQATARSSRAFLYFAAAIALALVAAVFHPFQP